jgi:beta-N-acetylhexosaminidase
VTFFEQYRPIGVILSRWNVALDERGNVNREKLRQLCDEIHRYSPYILIDQEGGGVQHLRGPNCYRAPAPGTFAEGMTESNSEEKCEALRQNVCSIDGDLRELGFDVNCAPVCDLLFDGVHSFIGNRSFGTDPDVVRSLAVSWVKQAAVDGMVSVLKHCPGHGSAVSDSHRGLPRVEKSLADLRRNDFKIFKDVIRTLYDDGIGEDSFWVMTAHILYAAIDPVHCATQSPEIIRMIREQFGFRGKIVSDCIMMKALQGELWERAIAALEAGCDYVICVNGDCERKRIIAEKVTEYLAEKGTQD